MTFRRQFLLGRATPVDRFLDRSTDPGQWVVLDTGPNRKCAVQHDLSHAIARNADKTVLCLGELIDPTRPQQSNDNIAQSLLAARSVPDAIRSCNGLGGRWAIYFRTPTTECMFHDPCGFRQIFFADTVDGPIIGSTSAILYEASCRSFEPDREVSRYQSAKAYAASECAMVGSKTQYQGCTHLLPNHLLDLSDLVSRRFFPADERCRLESEAVVPEAVAILNGTLLAITNRSRARMGLTAGYDSRVLLAVARHFLQYIDLYVDRHGDIAWDHMDVHTPRKITKTLGLAFEVSDSSEPPTEDFIQVMEHSIGEYRDLPKLRATYSAWKNGRHSWSVNGTGAEICRNFFDKSGNVNAENVTLDLMVRLLPGAKDLFVRQEIAAWWHELNEHGLLGYHPLDFLYWEQRMGNWGAKGSAEWEIASEVISPFNNRRLLTLLLGTERRYRTLPEFEVFRAMIRDAWPELLREPFNAPPRSNQIRQRLLKTLPWRIQKRIKGSPLWRS